MNLLAYHTTGLALKILSAFSRARVNLHNCENLPAGGTIFVINHFTRFETLLLPYHISKLLDKPVWSLAAAEFFNGLLGKYLDQVGAVSVADPERDKLIIRSLVGESGAWIIFPEGSMVKNRKVIDRGDFTIIDETGRHAPHTGAAALALKAEILRQRWLMLKEIRPDENDPQLASFDISPTTAMTNSVNIVPVNLTYYPLRSAGDLLQRFSNLLEEKVSKRLLEEILVEGSMLLEGVDIDIRFGRPVAVEPFVRKICGRRIPELVENNSTRDAIRKMTNGLLTSIYNQTTVNLDHIIASLLYKTRGAEFTETDLRRRAFMAATSVRWEAIYFRHRGLLDSQIDLLLEKAGGRVCELMDFAREKGLLRDLKSGKLIFTDAEGVCDGHAFHRIRVENPFRVMANTVEPLKPLQELLTRLTRLPGWYLRWLTAKRILKIMFRNYFHDRKALAETETAELCPSACGRPYLLNKFRPRVGIVLVHDWLAPPLSLKPLADFLGKQGFLVLVPRLPGHGTAPADLKERSYEKWQTAVDEAYAYATLRCTEVVVCGIGNSFALAFSLAVRGHNLAALIALFPALSGPVSEPAGGDDDAKDFVKDSGKDAADNADSLRLPLFTCQHAYADFPAASRREVKKMLTAAVKNLEKIKTPLLLCHDQSLDKSAQQLLQKYLARISSPEKELLLLPAAAPAALTHKNNHGAQALVDFIKRNTRF